MWAWPKGFDFDPVLRSVFESACEAQEVYGIPRENWNPKVDKPTADFVWAEAKRLLNY